MLTDNYDHLLKFLIIGDAGCGKSCLLHQFLENKFKGDSGHTIGVEFGSKIISVGGANVKLQIWDTAGQERFRSVTRSYYRGAWGALLVYDVTNRDSFNSLLNWVQDARSQARPDLVIVLAGNKIDLDTRTDVGQEDSSVSQRQVSYTEGSNFAQENDLIFIECSAKSAENVEELFIRCTQQVIRIIQQAKDTTKGRASRSGGPVEQLSSATQSNQSKCGC